MKELDVTRVTVVDENGRVYERTGLDSVHKSIQDDGKTLKLFINLQQ